MSPFNPAKKVEFDETCAKAMESFARIRGESVPALANRCPNCNGNGLETSPFDTNCPSAWAHRAVRPFAMVTPEETR